MHLMLTTEDNPFHPRDEFESWYEWDVSHGYSSLALLARVERSGEALSDEDQKLATEEAIKDIVEYNFSGKHVAIKVDDLE